MKTKEENRKDRRRKGWNEILKEQRGRGRRRGEGRGGRTKRESYARGRAADGRTEKRRGRGRGGDWE